MKIAKTILTSLSMIIGLISCSSDDNESTNTPSTIMDKLTAGIWYLQNETQTITDSCERNTSYDYKDDNTLVVQAYYEDGSGVCQHQAEGNFTFEIDTDNNLLTATQIPNGATAVYDIIELTDDELIIEREFNGYVNTITFDRTAG